MEGLDLKTFVKTALLILTGAMLPQTSWSKVFKTPFVKVDLPTNWDCKQEENDWVCQPDNLTERSEAIIIIVTKQVNEIDDTFPKYLQVLNTPRNMRDLAGNPYQSTVKFARQRDIKGQPWVDGMQLGSEVPGFFTRYTVSIKEQVAAMLTYSIGESVYPKYAQMMDQMIDSLEIHFDPSAFNDLKNKSTMSLLAQRGARGLSDRGAPTDEDDSNQNKQDDNMAMALLGVLIVAGVAYFVWKKKQQG